MKVKIYGAGSIGNHLANASRSLGWSVDICDIDPEALNRTKTKIYPGRYGKWDNQIGLYLSESIPKSTYDLICIGTPPDTHVELASIAIEENPQIILVEKPFCTPNLVGAQDLLDKAKENNVRIVCGYDHAVGEAAELFLHYAEKIGDIETLDVEFREHWEGIFRAHPWLSGPNDSYLGFWERGGGASGEHSHAIHLWQTFADALGLGKIIEVQAQMDYIGEGKANYDRLCFLNLRTTSGFIGRVVQDVVTKPTRKWGRAQGSCGAVEWIGGYETNKDAVLSQINLEKNQCHEIVKTRPDDFIRELKHIENLIKDDNLNSPLYAERAVEVMMILAAAHLSHAERGQRIYIDYNKNYNLEALSKIPVS